MTFLQYSFFFSPLFYFPQTVSSTDDTINFCLGPVRVCLCLCLCGYAHIWWNLGHYRGPEKTAFACSSQTYRDMKTNHCVWPADSAARPPAVGASLANLQHVTVPSKAFTGQAPTRGSTNKPWAVKAIINGYRSGFLCQSRSVMVLAPVCFIGRVWFPQTPSGLRLPVLEALFFRVTLM